VTVTRVEQILTDESESLRVAADVKEVEVAQDVVLPALVVTFDQLLVEIQHQSWTHLDDVITRLRDELEVVQRHVNRRAAREQDARNGGDIQTMYCHHFQCKQDREVLRSWEERNAEGVVETLAVELECRHIRRLRTFQ